MLNSIQEKKLLKEYLQEKREVYNVSFFYNLYIKKAKKYPPIFFEKTKKKRRKHVPFSLFKKIIKTYLTIYFEDFYKTNGSIYFPLGGFMKKVAYKKWARYMKRGSSNKKELVGSNGSVGFFWYLRPSPRFMFLLKIKKLTGSTNRLPVIERKYKNRYNKDLLPIFEDEFKKALNNKTLYICGLI